MADESPVRVSDIAGTLGLDLSAVSRPVSDFEAADPDDRRGRLVTVTANLALLLARLAGQLVEQRRSPR